MAKKSNKTKVFTKKELKAAKKAAKKVTSPEAEDHGIEMDAKAIKKAEKKAAKKLAKAGKDVPLDETAETMTHSLVPQELITDSTPARICHTLEKAFEKMPGKYSVETLLGTAILTVSENLTKTWELNGEKLSRTIVYNSLRVMDKKNWATFAADPSKETKPGGEEDGPSQKLTDATYKKKQLINALKASQIVKKAVIKKVKQGITEKSITGGEFIATLMDVSGEETPVIDLNKIFAELQ